MAPLLVLDYICCHDRWGMEQGTTNNEDRVMFIRGFNLLRFIFLFSFSPNRYKSNSIQNNSGSTCTHPIRYINSAQVHSTLICCLLWLSPLDSNIIFPITANGRIWKFIIRQANKWWVCQLPFYIRHSAHSHRYRVALLASSAFLYSCVFFDKNGWTNFISSVFCMPEHGYNITDI